LSHSHADHYGLIKYISPTTPLHLSEPTHSILKLNNIFLKQENSIRKPKFFSHKSRFNVGDISITPYLMDHSAFDSYAFLIESHNVKILYSGDFRNHGRKSGRMQEITKDLQNKIDYLILEGTTINRGDYIPPAETDLEAQFLELLRISQSINLVYTSSQNIDRIVSVYKACLRTNKTLVLDVYTANFLESLSKYSQIPHLSGRYKNLSILFNHSDINKLSAAQLNQYVHKFVPYKITREEISEIPNEYVMLVRPAHKRLIEKANLSNGNLIYSMWSGYKNQKHTAQFLDFLLGRNFTIHDIHTSGHADIRTLKYFVDRINPTNIIPIHTEAKDLYSKIFTQNVLNLQDGEEHKFC
jgi:ribonuclease J